MKPLLALLAAAALGTLILHQSGAWSGRTRFERARTAGIPRAVSSPSRIPPKPRAVAVARAPEAAAPPPSVQHGIVATPPKESIAHEDREALGALLKRK